jgi:pimeloyl-ACP methyl ester carboxylesterase
VQEWGAPDGAPLLYWHGLNPFGSLALNEAGPAWGERGFRVVAFVAPGVTDRRVLADPDAYRPSQLADAIVAAADELALETFAFVGWSWGASLGVHLAVRHPGRVRRLVLLDAGHTDIPADASVSLDDLVTAMSREQESYRFPTWDAFIESARETRPHWRAALEERLRAGMKERDGEIVARSDPRAAAAALHGLLQEQPSTTHRALGTTGIPVLLIVASGSDSGQEVERFRAAVPDADIRSLESGHDLLADAPEETIALVADWLLQSVDTFPQ